MSLLNTALTTSLDDLVGALQNAVAQVEDIVLGKPEEVRLAFTCLLAGGHLLLDDRPGLGKTTLARAMAATLGLGFQRVQCTSDLLPSDIVGVSVFEQQAGTFRFHPGPVFTEILLADEINRASPRTQSALLEAMAESQVTIDRQSHPLPDPFFVIATQNPIDMVGTFPLPDSQLDRFLFRIALGYPSAEAEAKLLRGLERKRLMDTMTPQLSASQVRQLRELAESNMASDALIDYVQALVTATRTWAGVRAGLSPRAALALLRGARAYALISGRTSTLPEDVQAIFLAVAVHRLVLEPGHTDAAEAIATAVLRAVPAL